MDAQGVGGDEARRAGPDDDDLHRLPLPDACPEAFGLASGRLTS
jgi:hypothetical protein